MPVIPPADHILVSVHLRDATQENKIPVGAMVGGLAGGAFLAIICTAGLLLWARALRRAKEQKKEAHRTKTNTRYNALPKPWPKAYRPMLLRPVEARVKFTEKSDIPPRTPSAPKPLRSTKTQLAEQQHNTPMWGVPRLPSTATSASVYSAESAEEHQIRAPTSLILAALGSVEAVFTRASWGDRRAPPHRGSQATSGSAYSEDIGVGVAY
ncbi:hypothetical protein C8F04DRAFT_198683 [Mycena alexandri]|uniref:Uncharacterized protein n=1 Tax=Mycena alexandri TaxID=1745969 RepID=A0AAD6TLQ6_9AGAR|nr:hypothetical protein C8F04DRAFT_198683 [Mycena alexandri]